MSTSIREVRVALLWWRELVGKAWALDEAHEARGPVRDVQAVVEVVPPRAEQEDEVKEYEVT